MERHAVEPNPHREGRMTSPIRIVVPGRPQTQGNHRRSPSGAVYDSNKRLKAWRAAVTWAARSAMAGRKPFADVPLVMDVTFYVERGGSKFAAPIAHQLGDTSKMLRAAEDSLTGVVYDDDSRIVRVTASKRYARSRPGAMIDVRRWDETDEQIAQLSATTQEVG
jgi:crossover junction endodeoxyribonuclease RusA